MALPFARRRGRRSPWWSAGGGHRASPASATAPPASTSRLSLAAQVGEKMFADTAPSASGKMACASCHDPKAAYGPPNDLAVQMGGPNLDLAGTRAVPSLRYKDATPPYADLLDNPDGISAPGPGGGFTWDGRAATLADQAQIPLLAANEMANAGPADVVARLQAAPYADLFRQAFGNNAFSDVRRPRFPASELGRFRRTSSKMRAFIHTAASTISMPATRSAAP